MRLADLVAPEAPTHRHDGQLGQDDGATDGGGHLLGALDAQAHVAVVVADGHEGLEAGALTGTSLLLHRHDLKHLVLESGAQEEVYDLELLWRGGAKIEMLQGENLPRSKKSLAKSGHRMTSFDVQKTVV